jgi:hypothetical protein
VPGPQALSMPAPALVLNFLNKTKPASAATCPHLFKSLALERGSHDFAMSNKDAQHISWFCCGCLGLSPGNTTDCADPLLQSTAPRKKRSRHRKIESGNQRTNHHHQKHQSGSHGFASIDYLSSAPFIADFTFGALGLRFVENKHLKMVEVVGVSGQASEQGVEGGDLLYSVNNATLSDGLDLRMSVADLGKMLRDSPRPIQVQFLRPKRTTVSVFHGTATAENSDSSSENIVQAPQRGSEENVDLRFQSMGGDEIGDFTMQSDSEEESTDGEFSISEVLLASQLM